MEVRVDGKVIDVRVVLLPKMSPVALVSGKEVSLPRLLILVIFTPLKAPTPIVSRLGNERSAISREVQPSKTLSYMVVTPDRSPMISLSSVH